ncbi:HD-GYP domain-containing protein [Pseudodesulfovibrio portus]|uniref:HD family phosphohydrolase n=1 Tax=Pseudodesulfovibrio portus TaxID=231439 RepID=A0ABN6RV72_9BACT|nr:HD-GYP domain-containing protein [Pseudodesulfovibrio portus]BDQ33887.1 HD family phosphohydrolase [Pseudodesulfovibrio portus]
MIKKISIDELEPGMEVVKLSSEMWEHLPHLYAEPGIIESGEQVARLKAEGYRQVFVQMKDENRGLTDEQRLDQLISNREAAPAHKERAPFPQAMKATRVTYESAMSCAMRIVNDAKLGRKMDYQAAVDTASAIVDCAIRNPDTLVCLSKLSEFDDYTYTHSINVAAIAVVFGEYIGMTREELVDLGMAGMMHDLGKTSVDQNIVNKPAKLTPEEFAEMRKHPAYGFVLLKSNPDIPSKVLEAVRLHHEKYNGSGYPSGLTRREIPAFARIICLADIYDALTSNRCYRDAILPNKALGIMYGMREQEFDPLEIQLFIKCLGIFPSGSLVQLNTGDYAVVRESNPGKPLSPKIRVILNKTMHPIRARDVNLADGVKSGDTELEIIECADPGVYKKSLINYMTAN